MANKKSEKTLSVTVDVEEWFHTDFFDVEKVINKHYDGEYPNTDVIENVEKLIKLFDKNDVEATFFVLGETAEKYDELLPLLEETDHEIACHGYYHNKKYDDLSNFREDLKKFKTNIEDDVVGFRYPNYNISDEKLKIIQEIGFKYDSSIVPCRNIPGWYGNPKLPLKPYRIELNGKDLIEMPVSVSPSLRLPGAGGWYLRNVGYWWTKHVLKSTIKKTSQGVLYLHPWELSDNNPVHEEIPFHVFRNCGKKSEKRLKKILRFFDKRDLNFETLNEKRANVEVES